MSNAAILVYHSVKFEMDNWFYELKKRKGTKYYKLLGDVILLLSNGTKEDIAESIEIAKKWQIKDMYLNAIKKSSGLIPEFSFKY